MIAILSLLLIALSSPTTIIFVHGIASYQQQKITGLQGADCPFCLFGSGVSLSSDGNTALVGEMGYENSKGGAFVFVRSENGTWQQQGGILQGTPSYDQAGQGQSVSLSSDGTVAFITGSKDSTDGGKIYNGAGWIFELVEGEWTQKAKLIGTEYKGSAYQGDGPCGLSGNGKTACLGGPFDNNCVGATWVFTLNSKKKWVQVGKKLIGTDAIYGTSGAAQGSACALNDAGTLMIESAADDNNNIGAVWIFAQSGKKWVQKGGKIVPNDYSGAPQFGTSVSLDSAGDTAVVGGYLDDGTNGAVWVFTRGANDVFTQLQPKLSVVTGAGLGYSVAIIPAGNLFVVGASYYSSSLGEVLLYELVDGKYEQTGTSMIGTGNIGERPLQGYAVAIDAQGDTILSGAVNDGTNSQGAVWVFTQKS